MQAETDWKDMTVAANADLEALQGALDASSLLQKTQQKALEEEAAKAESVKDAHRT